MNAERRNMLEHIINDASSSVLERDEARRELKAEGSEQDKTIERYLDGQISADEWPLVDDETKAFCLGITVQSLLGEMTDHREKNLDHLIQLYGRSSSQRVKAAIVYSVRSILTHKHNLLLPENRAKHDAYIDEAGYDQQLTRRLFFLADGWAGVERVARKASQFLDAVNQ